MSGRYNEFVQNENIKDFNKKLETETDPPTREMLLRLLAEEQAARKKASKVPPTPYA